MFLLFQYSFLHLFEFCIKCLGSRNSPTKPKTTCRFLDSWVVLSFWAFCRVNSRYSGGYTLGSASGAFSGVFDGSDLIKEAGGNVVAVVIQYRLGVLGFLSSSQIKANGALNAGLCTPFSLSFRVTLMTFFQWINNLPWSGCNSMWVLTAFDAYFWKCWVPALVDQQIWRGPNEGHHLGRIRRSWFRHSAHRCKQWKYLPSTLQSRNDELYFLAFAI